jgi:GLPGLI family protein
MKQLILFLLITLPYLSDAQISGEIIYEEKMNLHRRIPEERAEMKEMIPEFRTENMVLLFNEEEAVYKKYVDENQEVDEDVDMSRGGGRRMGFRNMRSNTILYQNYQEEKRIEQREFFDKKFLITGEPHYHAWKLEAETRDVGDYTAHKATLTDSTRTIVAWYVPELTVPLGPDEYGQLPGLVVHVDINDGERTITATKINLRKINPEEIIKPTKGKEMTEVEFRAMVKEKMEENGMGRRGMRVMTRPGPH